MHRFGEAEKRVYNDDYERKFVTDNLRGALEEISSRNELSKHIPMQGKGG